MNKLKQIRFFKDVTQPLLALKTGIHQSRISLIENGLVTPRDEEKKKIAKSLQCTVEEVFPSRSSVNGI